MPPWDVLESTAPTKKGVKLDDGIIGNGIRAAESAKSLKRYHRQKAIADYSYGITPPPSPSLLACTPSLTSLQLSLAHTPSSTLPTHTASQSDRIITTAPSTCHSHATLESLRLTQMQSSHASAAPESPLKSSMFEQTSRCNRILNEDFIDLRYLTSQGQHALASWEFGQEISEDTKASQQILDMWTDGALREWGRRLYVTCISKASDSFLFEELEGFLLVGEALDRRIASISHRAFEVDPSGLNGIWHHARMLSCDVARVVSVVEEFLLLLRDGGAEALEQSFQDKSLNFQSF
ncbi:hypothetical protein BD410DRAFT_808840 [Rickenella mellea]|uniref:Uncharacterized protein n=1 Tax=Rickenella mellea TaxID=50990 RepID=A0A4Y7PKP6_9AGAM|nr:hypothetical protein BD410DRAFT_808840 [Rickenella mellea]